MNRTCRVRTHQQKRLRQHLMNTDSYNFFNILTGAELLDQVEEMLPEHRERLFPPTEVLSMFLAQALGADRSCQRAVNNAAIKRVSTGLAGCSTHTGAYCRARRRCQVLCFALKIIVKEQDLPPRPCGCHAAEDRIRCRSEYTQGAIEYYEQSVTMRSSPITRVEPIS